ncbi:MAG: ATP-dependent Clp protease ATP-binding subunit [Candidatus Jorgensenbacteria bacterium]|nr:ATP-dependent Clp protease ATP-binding subunit [Candidatus Jorgensenbacteria bacterium]
MLYFDEQRLRFTAIGDFFVRLITYSAYALLSIGAFFFLVSTSTNIKALGVLFAIFLIDRALHVKDGERSIPELKGEKRNVSLAFTPSAHRVLSRAFRKSRAIGKNFYLILLQELIERHDIKESLTRLSVNIPEFEKRVNNAIRDSKQDSPTKEELLSVVESLSISAYGEAVQIGEEYIHGRNLFVALSLVGDPSIARLFELAELSTANIKEAIIFGRWRKAFFGGIPSALSGFVNIHRSRGTRKVMNRAWTSRPTPLLDRFSTDITDVARGGGAGFLIGHEKEYDALLRVVSRIGKPNVLIVGEPGSGKTSIIAHLAYRMSKDDVPAVLFDKRLISIDIGALISDTNTEALAGRLKGITDEILSAGNVVLHIANMHDLFRTGQAKAINAIDMLLPVIINEGIPVIGESFPREFKQFIEPRTDFLAQFDVVNVDELSEEDSVRFLIYSSLILEREYGVFITFRAIEKAVNLAHRYFHERLLPGSAEDLLKQALSNAKTEKLKTLDASAVIAVAEKQSKVPIEQASELEAEKLLNLESIIHERFVNQDSAVSSVSRALREYRSGLSRKGGPIATFLFVGPTGVGKTELAKILAGIQFGSKDLMQRFDMSEYQDKQSIFQLTGTPNGDRGGALTDAVLKNPYCLVLLDEFEKAHPDILNLFLQVFDDGRLTDSSGRTVDFQNTIIIATSNANSKYIKDEIEKGTKIEDIAVEIKKKLTDYFKPELVNRFSDIIVFRDLKPEEIYVVAKFLIKDVVGTLRTAQGVDLRVDDSALLKISELGFSPVFGARPLRQVVSEKVRSTLAEKILRREIVRGSVLLLKYENEKFVWENVDDGVNKVQ